MECMNSEIFGLRGSCHSRSSLSIVYTESNTKTCTDNSDEFANLFYSFGITQEGVNRKVFS